MIRVYENYTREISMLSGDNPSFWQPSQTVSSLRQNLAHQTKENGKKAQTFIVSPAGETVCEVCAHYRLGRNAPSGRLYRFGTFEQVSGSTVETKEAIAERFMRASWRRPLLQVQTDGLGNVCYGGETGQISSSILPRSGTASGQGKLRAMAYGCGCDPTRDQEAR